MPSLRFWTGAASLLVVLPLLLLPAPASAHRAPAAADTTSFPHPTEDRDSECGDHIAGCAVGAVLYTVFGPVLHALFSDVRISGTGGPVAAVSLRAGRTFRASSATQRVRPYAAIGMRSQQPPASVGAIGAPTVFLETVAGLRSPAHLWMHGSAPWLERIQLAAEMQWLHNGGSADQLWVEAAPALLTTSAPDTRLALAPTLSVAVAGPQRGVVRPGLSIGVHW